MRGATNRKERDDEKRKRKDDELPRDATEKPQQAQHKEHRARYQVEKFVPHVCDKNILQFDGEAHHGVDETVPSPEGIMGITVPAAVKRRQGVGDVLNGAL